MNNADLYFSANEQLQLKNLLPIDEEYFEKIDKSDWNAQYQQLTFSEWQKVLSQNGYEVNRIVRNSNERSIRQYFYKGEYMTPEIHVLDPDWLTNPFSLSALKADEMGQQDFENKNYAMYFFSERNLFAIDYFLKHFDKIDENLRYSAFKSLYVLCNYGFELFPQATLEKVFERAGNQDITSELKEHDLIEEDGYVTIYRGEGTRSTPLEQTLSWTLSLEVANRFGHFHGKGKTYRARVKAEKIIDFINEHNEEEIWVRFKDVEDVEVLDF